MSKRYDGLKKIPAAPAARLLAAAGAKLETQTNTPAAADVSTVLTALEANYGWIDMIRLMSVALPPRECVWWACLAGRDITGGADTPSLKASETWVFDPTEENRAQVQLALDNADTDDDTTLVATAALYGPGTLGPGDAVKEVEAPVGALASCAFGINMLSMNAVDDPLAHIQLILDRALDIARGGNGQVDPPDAMPLAPPEDPDPDDDDDDDADENDADDMEDATA